ncbi:MAG: response regulator, partial [Bryobacterales bacterium]|nr:response regulator [Bryobacterales bacterium]
MGERILREEGYEVVTVTDGETAILRVKDVNPDVVIVDAFLPQVSGYDLCGFIKKQSQHSHVRVLLTSTALERVDEDHMYRVGADGQLKKPFEASVMLKSLKDLISGSEKDSKKKRGASTFNLNDYEEGSTGEKVGEVMEAERTTEKAGVSPLKAWLEQHDDNGVSKAEPHPEPIAVGATVGAATAAAAAEPVSLSNPQLLRRMEDEEEDLSLRNNPVAKLRNAPVSPSEGTSRLQSISGRSQDPDADSGPTTRSFRMK